MPANPWTYESLAKVDRARLEEVLRTGTPPDPEQMNGYIYCGWNHEWVGNLSGEKFKKGFYKKDGKYLGYNEIVVQDRKGPAGEWKVEMRNGRPTQLAFFRVSYVRDEPVEQLNKPYRHLGHLNYNLLMNKGTNIPFKVIRDFSVLPNPGDHSLILCKAYFQVFPWLNIFYCYFLLGHRQEIEFKPW